jgi:hypothetical protein
MTRLFQLVVCWLAAVHSSINFFVIYFMKCQYLRLYGAKRYMLMNNEFKRNWKETVMAQSKALSLHWPGGIELKKSLG